MKKYLPLLPVFYLLFASFCTPKITAEEKNAQQLRLETKSAEALAYCKKNNLSTAYCVLIDMKMHSGKKRAYLWDFKKDTVALAGMCSHGCCSNPWGETTTKSNPSFSNVPDSHCSSLGKYKVGARGYSSWGIHVNYKLLGLEATNSNAFKREIVLHSWEEVPGEEVYPVGIPEGWGCPAVSNVFMATLDSKLKSSEIPVLLWIFN